MMEASRSAPKCSRLAVAVAAALLAMPLAVAAASSSPAEERSAEDKAYAAMGVDLAALHARTARLNAALSVPAGKAGPVSVAAPAGATPAAGPYFKVDGATTDDLEEAAATWRTDEFNADWGKAAIGAEYAYAMGYTGTGVKVGVLDSGVDIVNWGETEFAGRLHPLDTRAGVDVPEDEGIYEYVDFDGTTSIGQNSEHWHGTHVSGTIGAARNGEGAHGVAWAADIYSASLHNNEVADGYMIARALNREPLQLWSSVTAAYQALTAQGVRVINNSWGENFVVNPGLDSGVAGFPFLGFPRDDMVALLKAKYESGGVGADHLAAFRAAAAQGAVSVFSAGNSTSAMGTVVANSQASLPMAFRDLEPHWIAVTALQPGQASAGEEGAPPNFELASFSQVCGDAKYWCVGAPGVDIRSTAAYRRFDKAGAKAFMEELRAHYPEQIDFDSPTGLTDWFTEQKKLLDSAPEQVDPLFMLVELGGLRADPAESWRFWLASLVQIIYLGDQTIWEERFGEASTQAMAGDKELMAENLNTAMDAMFALWNAYIEMGLVSVDEATAYFRAAGEETGRIFNTYGEVQSGDLLSGGTSMAAPHVSGALAVVMDRFKYLDSAQARDVLLTTAKDLGETGVDELYGWGMIDLQSAMGGPGALLRDWSVNLQGSSDTWTNDLVNGRVHTACDEDHGRLVLDGPGSLTLLGSNAIDGFEVNAGILTLSNANTVTQDTLVNGGAFVVADGGSLAGANLRVDNGLSLINGAVTGNALIGAEGWLQGSGRLVGDLRVEGTIAPGNAIDAFTVEGNYTQVPGSVFLVELTPPDQSNRLHVTGQAGLEGGTLQVVRLPGIYTLGQRYTVLVANGGLTGMFDAIDQRGLSPFLRIGDIYTANSLFLDVLRGKSVASEAKTRNQRATGTAVDRSPDANPIVQRLLTLFPAEALPALDLLGGEAHAGIRTGMVNDVRRVRELSLDRASASRGPEHEDRVATGGLWLEALGTGGRVHADGNGAEIEGQGRGWLLGGDYVFESGFGVGALLGTGNVDFDARARQSRNESNVRHAGVHLGWSNGGFGIKAGYVRSDYEVKSRRVVAFDTLADVNTARYDADASQAFVELGYAFDLGKMALEPFARYARIDVDSDGFSEVGGVSALTVRDGATSVDSAQLGVKFSVGLGADTHDDAWLRLTGGLSAVRNSGDLVSVGTVAWNGGQSFEVAGSELSRNMTQGDLGVQAWLSRSSVLDFGYSGRFSSNGNDHALNARYTYRF